MDSITVVIRQRHKGKNTPHNVGARNHLTTGNLTTIKQKPAF